MLDGLRECKLPVAPLGVASTSDAFPSSWFPLNLVCPLTEFSAEFQAIAFALEGKETEAGLRGSFGRPRIPGDAA